MPIPPAVARALVCSGLDIKLDAPLARRVWWRVGGPADALVTVRTEAELLAALALASDHGLPTMVLGNGSNLLVADAGVRGLVLVLAGELAGSEVQGGRLVVGGGLKLVVLLNRAAKLRWCGVEVFAGIPGTVGGAVRMNAGASLGEAVDVLDEVAWVHEGAVHRAPAVQIGFAYRHCGLPEGAVVTQAWLRQRGDDWPRCEAAMRAHLDHRKATQPLDLPSCGSTFRNPEGDAAGRLIEAAGLKGFSVGGAAVSRKHANFIVNTGTATAADVAAVIAAVRERVAAAHGVWLHPEVRMVGDWGD